MIFHKYSDMHLITHMHYLNDSVGGMNHIKMEKVLLGIVDLFIFLEGRLEIENIQVDHKIQLEVGFSKSLSWNAVPLK